MPKPQPLPKWVGITSGILGTASGLTALIADPHVLTLLQAVFGLFGPTGAKIAASVTALSVALTPVVAAFSHSTTGTGGKVPAPVEHDPNV